jgi:hypothetical protein
MLLDEPACRAPPPLRHVGSSFDPPTPLPPDIEQGARTLLVERGP